MQFSHALVRPPGSSFPKGITTVVDDPPDLALALDQHAAYVAALRACGLEIHELIADDCFPDSTFVEDTAVVAGGTCVITRPGAEERRGEVGSIRAFFERRLELDTIEGPGTVDGGDVCDADGTFFIGVSSRTNEEGARQLAVSLSARGFKAVTIDLKDAPGLLHLKSGLSYLGDGRVVVDRTLADHPALASYERIIPDGGEEYAANCVRVRDSLLFPAGYPGLRERVVRPGLNLIELECSEFRKMDGGLSCLSIRW